MLQVDPGVDGPGQPGHGDARDRDRAHEHDGEGDPDDAEDGTYRARPPLPPVPSDGARAVG